MNLDELIQLQVLKRKATFAGVHPGSKLFDDLLENSPEPEVRQMCAKVSGALYARLEQVCGGLDVTKRQFIEWAVLDAIQRAEHSITSAFGEDE